MGAKNDHTEEREEKERTPVSDKAFTHDGDGVEASTTGRAQSHVC